MRIHAIAVTNSLALTVCPNSMYHACIHLSPCIILSRAEINMAQWIVVSAWPGQPYRRMHRDPLKNFNCWRNFLKKFMDKKPLVSLGLAARPPVVGTDLLSAAGALLILEFRPGKPVLLHCTCRLSPD